MEGIKYLKLKGFIYINIIRPYNINQKDARGLFFSEDARGLFFSEDAL